MTATGVVSVDEIKTRLDECSASSPSVPESVTQYLEASLAARHAAVERAAAQASETAQLRNEGAFALVKRAVDASCEVLGYKPSSFPDEGTTLFTTGYIECVSVGRRHYDKTSVVFRDAETGVRFELKRSREHVSRPTEVPGVQEVTAEGASSRFWLRNVSLDEEKARPIEGHDEAMHQLFQCLEQRARAERLPNATLVEKLLSLSVHGVAEPTKWRRDVSDNGLCVAYEGDVDESTIRVTGFRASIDPEAPVRFQVDLRTDGFSGYLGALWQMQTGSREAVGLAEHFGRILFNHLEDHYKQAVAAALEGIAGLSDYAAAQPELFARWREGDTTLMRMNKDGLQFVALQDSSSPPNYRLLVWKGYWLLIGDNYQRRPPEYPEVAEAVFEACKSSARAPRPSEPMNEQRLSLGQRLLGWVWGG